MTGNVERVRMGGHAEFHPRGTQYLIKAIVGVTNDIERRALLAEPPLLEAVKFAIELRNSAVMAAFKGDLVNFPAMDVPGGEAGKLIEDVTTYEHAGRIDYVSAWGTKIPQLWLSRDETDPKDIRRRVLGTDLLITSGGMP